MPHITIQMYPGRDDETKKRLCDAILETASKELARGKEHFSVSVNVEVSPQFYGWLAGFGANAKIVSPKEAAGAYREYLEGILKSYT